jgi:hypothetical protein
MSCGCLARWVTNEQAEPDHTLPVPMNPGQSWRYRKARLRQILEIVGDDDEAEGIVLDEHLNKRPKSTGETTNVPAWRCLTMRPQQEKARI